MNLSTRDKGIGAPEAAAATMLIGINYPWLTCGHDFGDDPPEWSGADVRRDWDTVCRDFATFRSLGISIVRCWIFAGGVNLPVGSSWNGLATIKTLPGSKFSERFVKAIHKGLRSRKSQATRRDLHLDLHGELPTLPARFTDEFSQLLSLCREYELQLIPSLMSFEFFQPAIVLPDGVVKRGRGSFVFGGDDRMENFFQATLDPLLAASTASRDAIWAWELINEPDWVVRSGPRQVDAEHYGILPAPRLIHDKDMCSFLRAGLQRVEKAGFRATIGFKAADPKWLSASLRAELIALGKRGRYVHQLHHYPTAVGEWTLPRHETLPIRPCIVGEFPTAQGGTTSNIQWRDKPLRETERDPEHYLSARISHIKECGYPGALLWSARATDARSQWTRRQQQQLLHQQ